MMDIESNTETLSLRIADHYLGIELYPSKPICFADYNEALMFSCQTLKSVDEKIDFFTDISQGSIAIYAKYHGENGTKVFFKSVPGADWVLLEGISINSSPVLTIWRITNLS